MAYRLRYQVGDIVPLVLCTTNAAGSPILPDGGPQARVFSPKGVLVASFPLAIMDKYIQPGMFYGSLYLADPFIQTGAPADLWSVAYSWSYQGYTGQATDTFEIVPGGSQFGNVVSMYFYRRPDANYIVWQCDSGPAVSELGSDGEQHLGGQLFTGRNPSI